MHVLGELADRIQCCQNNDIRQRQQYLRGDNATMIRLARQIYVGGGFLRFFLQFLFLWDFISQFYVWARYGMRMTNGKQN